MDADARLRIATCQFNVVDDIKANLAAVEDAIGKAAQQRVDLVHFCEAALSGYPGTDLYTWDGYDWDTLRSAVTRVQALAAQHKLWVVVGSAHWVAQDVPPLNSVYVIALDGKIHDRYDKSMLTAGDQMFYTAGDHRVTLELKGIKLGFLICYDGCYPEMYAAYRDDGVQVMLHSFYNAGFMGENILDEVGPAWLRVRAADNAMHIVANNSSRVHSSWPSCIARPDGSLGPSLQPNTPGVLVHAFPDEELKGWPHNVKPMKLHPDEVYFLGNQSDHPRVKNRQSPP